jgi:DNA-binding NarL/FixJ family response regulator
MLLNIGERRRFVYRIAVLTDLKHEGEHYAKVINDYCINQKLFPLLETYQNQEVFFKEIQTHVPDIVLLVLPGVDGLNAAEHLRSLFPGCGIIWCSNLDFSLHAFRLRVEYFFLEPVRDDEIQEGLRAWFRLKKQSFKQYNFRRKMNEEKNFIPCNDSINDHYDIWRQPDCRICR